MKKWLTFCLVFSVCANLVGIYSNTRLRSALKEQTQLIQYFEPILLTCTEHFEEEGIPLVATVTKETR
jgi:hypothetical protein